MLLKLVPVAPQPTVLFSLAFRNIEAQGVESIPQAWDTQLNALLADELEVPQGTHALDKAAGIPSLLDEVCLDIPSLTVSCRFLDGALEEWPLMERVCLEKLDRVVSDVRQSAEEAQKEQRRDMLIREIGAERARERAQSDTPAQQRQKKHRSLLKSMFSSRKCAQQQAGSSASLSPLTSPASAEQALEELEATRAVLSARALRRRARSTLVDVFRRYVLPELVSRFPPGGYYAWVTASMVRRAHARMEELIHLAAKDMPDGPASYHRAHMSMSTSTSTHLPGPDDCDDETDTDGSSIRTPTGSETPSLLYPAGRHSFYSSISSCSSAGDGARARPAERAEYAAFATLVRRLQRLLVDAQYRREQEEDDARAHEAVVEVRSRRRAWLNGALAGAGVHDLGHSSPYSSSRLARAAWTAEEYEYAPAPAPPMRRLIYESEDEGDEGDEDARELELALDLKAHGIALRRRLDLDGGVEVRKPPLPVDAALLRRMEVGFEAGIPGTLRAHRGPVHIVGHDEWPVEVDYFFFFLKSFFGPRGYLCWSFPVLHV
ncbi:hypothetical protein HDZ31DRAFT_49239 [Schizophyllum fasciatum]